MSIRDTFRTQRESRNRGLEAVLSATPKSSETLSPQEFMALSAKAISNIDKIDFIPPVIGRGSFGEFKVKYLKPKLVVGG